MTIEDKMLEFKALNEKTNTWEAPVWRETDTRNDRCPKCDGVMVVVCGQTTMYAVCHHCKRTFVSVNGE